MTRNPGITGALILVLFTVVLLQVLPGEQALDFLAAVLVAAGAVYIGAALAGDDNSTLALEVIAGVAFIAVALLGRWYAVGILAWGYFAHGAWDFLHHRGIAGANAGKTFPVLCWVYDWTIAVVILLWF
ncbi:MAG: DUF6010 family protein [Pseudomonadales bacterium]